MARSDSMDIDVAAICRTHDNVRGTVNVLRTSVEAADDADSVQAEGVSPCRCSRNVSLGQLLCIIEVGREKYVNSCYCF